jgi:hypothetical protein
VTTPAIRTSRALRGVGSVSTTGFLGDRMQRAMSEQGAGFQIQLTGIKGVKIVRVTAVLANEGIRP